MKKRAISGVVALVLLILIVIVAVFLIWVLVFGFLSEDSRLDCFDNSVFLLDEGYTYWDPNERILSVQVLNSARGQGLGGVGISIFAGEKSYIVENKTHFPKSLNEKYVYYFNFSNLNANPEYIEVYPILVDGRVCQKTSSVRKIRKGVSFQGIVAYSLGEPLANLGVLGSVKNLRVVSKSSDWIYWEWENPSGFDFREAIIYVNGLNVANTSNNYYNATGLMPLTQYTIKIHTKNLTYVNNTDVISSDFTEEAPIYVSSCMELKNPNKIYVLRNNVESSGTCFNITANNVTLDGAGFSVVYGKSPSGDSFFGVYSFNNSDLKVRNIKVSHGYAEYSGTERHGIHFNSVINSSISSVFINSSGSHCIFLNESSNVNISSSNFSYCFFGIFLLNSSFIDSYRLSTRDNYIGLNIEGGYSNKVYNFDSYGEPVGMLLDSTNGNLIYNSKSIGSIHGLVLEHSNNNYFNYLHLENSLSHTLYFYKSSNNIFSNINTQYSLENGISGSYSKNNTFENIVCKHNNRSGLYFYDFNNSKFRNILSENNSGESGLSFWYSYNNSLYDVRSGKNKEYGLLMYRSRYFNFDNFSSYDNLYSGITLQQVRYSNFSNVFLYNNGFKGLEVITSVENNFSNLDSFLNDDFGIYFFGSNYFNSFRNVRVYDNNITGVAFIGSNFSSFINASVFGNLYGVTSEISYNNSFYDSNISSNKAYGVSLIRGNSLFFYNSRICGNPTDFNCSSSSFVYGSNNYCGVINGNCVSCNSC